jgi:hypothetical protein
MIQMSVGEEHGVEYQIWRGRRPVQRLCFLAALKLTAINQYPRLLRLHDVTGAGYFAASCSNEGDFHPDNCLVIVNWLTTFLVRQPY